MIVILFQTSLPAGQGDALRAAAEPCIAAARTSPDGTLLYDWFLNEETGFGALVEAYDSNEALLAHMGALREARTPPPPGENPTLLILGGLNEKMQGAVQRWPGTSWFGPVLDGLNKRGLRKLDPAAIDARTVITSARFKVPQALRAEFEAAVPGLIERVGAQEPDTLAYEWFASGDELAVLEIYRDEAARQHHLDQADDTFRALVGKLDVSAIYYGGLSPEGVAAATAQPGRIYAGARVGGMA